MTPSNAIQCYQCGTRVTLAELVSNQDDCPECGAAHTLKDVARAIDLIDQAKSTPAEVAQGEVIHQWEFADAWMDTDEAGAASARCEGYTTRIVYTAPPSPDAELVELLRNTFPRIDPCKPVPLDEKAHCCEYTIYVERERLHRLIDAKLASLEVKQ